MTKQEINALVKERYNLIQTDAGNERIQSLRDQVLLVFRERSDEYEVDFIIETLTMFGYAPNIVFDDNGLFAVSGTGSQPIVTGRQKIEGAISVYVEKKQWKKTIRLAIKHYLATGFPLLDDVRPSR